MANRFINIPVLITVLVMLVIVFAIVFFFLYRNYCDEECRIKLYKEGAQTSNKPQHQQVPQQSQQYLQFKEEPVYERDIRVLRDPLYPPLNRTDAQSFNLVKTASERGDINIRTRDYYDQYRLIGYLISTDTTTQDSGGNNWKLFGRQRQSNRADFYIIPTNNNYDMKIPITDDMTVGEKIREVYSIPPEVTFNSPLLNKAPYKYIELPKTDLQSSQYL